MLRASQAAFYRRAKFDILLAIPSKHSVCGMENSMKSTLIKDTTKEERIALIKAWIPADDSMDEGKDMDLWDIYADYINGKREIAEINAQMSGTFYTEEDM